MIELLVCSVLFISNGVPAETETEECFIIRTETTIQTACLFAGGGLLAGNRYLTFCRIARGRVKP